jgi:glycosyltransferase involved in cell wall biosynthesis
VATDGFEIADEVRQTGAGLLVPAGVTVSTLVQALLDLLADRERLRQMREASARLGQKYSWEAVASRYRELYLRLEADSTTRQDLGNLLAG